MNDWMTSIRLREPIDRNKSRALRMLEELANIALGVLALLAGKDLRKRWTVECAFVMASGWFFFR